MKTLLSLVLALAVVFTAALASAQAPPGYGVPISLEQAKKVMAGAEAEAKKNNWPVVIVVLDSGGQLVMLQRLDNAQWGSVDIAKALEVNVEFDLSRQFWSYLIKKGAIASPDNFIHPVPHMSFVIGADRAAFLKKRHAAMSAGNVGYARLSSLPVAMYRAPGEWLFTE